MSRRLHLLSENREEPMPLAVMASGTGGMLHIVSARGEFTADNQADAQRLLTQFIFYRMFSLTRPASTVTHLGSEHFTGTRLRGATPKIRSDSGPTILGAYRVPLGNYDLATAFDALTMVDEWLANHGVCLGGRGYSAYQLWQSSLTTELSVKNPIGGKHHFGARKGSPYAGHTFRDCYYVDIRAAYPNEMDGCFPSILVRDPAKGIHHEHGAVLAKIKIPESLGPWFPIAEPTRIGPEWHAGSVRGWWPLSEFRYALDCGVEPVEIEAVYMGVKLRPIFQNWLELAEGLRGLPGAAGKIGKTITSTLWGVFAMTQPSYEVRYLPGQGYPPRPDSSTKRVRPPPPSDTAMWSAEIASRVRVRIHKELIPSNPIYVDTDGGVIRQGSRLPDRMGNAIGDWTIKERMQSFTPRGVGAYKWSDWQDYQHAILSGVQKATIADVDAYGSAKWDGHRAAFFIPKQSNQDPWLWDIESQIPVMLHPRNYGKPLPPWRFAIDPQYAGMDDLREAAILSGIPSNQWPSVIESLPRTLTEWQRTRRKEAAWPRISDPKDSQISPSSDGSPLTLSGSTETFGS